MRGGYIYCLHEMYASLRILIQLAVLSLCTSFLHLKRPSTVRDVLHGEMSMVLDDFLASKLDGMKRSFDALTERLADPDLVNNRKEILRVSRERKGMEPTVESYEKWKSLEKERVDLLEMEQGDDAEIKEIAKMVWTNLICTWKFLVWSMID